MKKSVLIATTNKGKFEIYSAILKKIGINAISLLDMKVDIKVEENGKDEIENAIIKAKAYHEATKLPVIANDSGLIIDKFAPEDQPGLFVRRFKGKELTDEEMVNMFANKLKLVGGESEGHYNVGLAVIDEQGELHSKMFYPKRYFVSSPSKTIKKGIPLSSLSYDKETKKYMSEMTPEEMNTYEGKEMSSQAKFIEDIFLKA